MNENLATNEIIWIWIDLQMGHIDPVLNKCMKEQREQNEKGHFAEIDEGLTVNGMKN